MHVHNEAPNHSRQTGYEERYRDGYSAGQRDTIARANQEMLKQMAYTKRHVEDKAILAMQLEQARSEIEALRAEIARAEEERCEQLWQNNRIMVFANATRATLEELAVNGSSVVIQSVFRQRYQNQIEKALASGKLRIALEKDDTFATTLPKAHRFVAEMLADSTQ